MGRPQILLMDVAFTRQGRGVWRQNYASQQICFHDLPTSTWQIIKAGEGARLQRCYAPLLS